MSGSRNAIRWLTRVSIATAILAAIGVYADLGRAMAGQPEGGSVRYLHEADGFNRSVGS